MRDIPGVFFLVITNVVVVALFISRHEYQVAGPLGSRRAHAAGVIIVACSTPPTRPTRIACISTIWKRAAASASSRCHASAR